MILLDDLHRADLDSLAFLRFIAPELPSVPVLVVGAFREAELAEEFDRETHVSGLLRDPGAEWITLEGLDTSEVTKLARALRGFDLSVEVGERLRAHTGGNPFFLRHLLPEFDADGFDDSSRYRLPKLSRGIQGTLVNEIDRLQPRLRNLLRAASVLGREFDLSLAAEVAELGVQQSLGDLHRPIALRFVAQDPRRPETYRFVHELVREAIYENLAPLERASLHQRAGAFIERRNGAGSPQRLAELARHFVQAVSLTGPAKAFQYALAAAKEASSRFAYEDAATGYRLALDLLDRMDSTESAVSVECECLIALAEAEARSGDREAAARTGRRAIDLARALGSPTQVAQAALAVSPGFFALEIGVSDPQLASVLELALQSLEPVERSDWELRTRLLERFALCRYWSGRRDDLEGVSDDATAAARHAASELAYGHSLAARHAAHGHPGAAPQRLAIATEIVRYADGAAHMEQALMGRVFRVSALLELGRVGELDAEIAGIEQIVHRWPQPQSHWYAGMYRAMRSLMRGHFDDARRLARDYFDLGRRISDNNVLHCYAAHTLIATLECSLSDEIVPAAEAHMNRHPEYPAWRAGFAWGCAEAGHHEVAESMLSEAVEKLLDELPRDVNWLNTIALFAYTAWLIGDPRHAKKLYQLLAPYAGGVVTAGFGMVYFGTVEGYLARLASLADDREGALAHHVRAVASERLHGAEPWAIRCLESQSHALMRVGHRTEAIFVADTAIHGARRLGMVRVAGRLEALRAEMS